MEEATVRTGWSRRRRAFEEHAWEMVGIGERSAKKRTRKRVGEEEGAAEVCDGVPLGAGDGGLPAQTADRGG